MEERKRLIFLGLLREPIKLRAKKFALFTEATGALPVSQGSEDAECLPVQVLENRADKWMKGASMLQGTRWKRKWVGERENDWCGVTKLLWVRPICYFLKRIFYTFTYTQREMKDARSYRVSQNIPAVLPLLKPGFFLHTFPTNDVVYIIFWPWRPVNILWPSFDKGCSTRKLIFPQSVFSLYF